MKKLLFFLVGSGVVVLVFVFWVAGWLFGVWQSLEMNVHNFLTVEEVRGSVTCDSITFEQVYKETKSLKRGLLSFSVVSYPAHHHKLRIKNSAGESVTVSIGHFNNDFYSTNSESVKLTEGAQMLTGNGVLKLSNQQRESIIEIGNPEPNDHPYATVPGTLEHQVDYYSVFIGLGQSFIPAKGFEVLQRCAKLPELIRGAFEYSGRINQPSPHIFLYQLY